ncbi:MULTISPECIES: carbon-nitrogen hydrolase family protein [Hydrocarboniphaga]|jgi:nitrilase|uniref:Nitrilase/cyanide hydratase and apolipoprotein N-acyltransferase n=1 Tax=Hydrocarboniphaga effusa AP103 TaxID=1172194 RepID=I8T4Z1_9GAMM|nr:MULTISPECIES: carbon-nitrogen hydrolase family protein [Hydrocarboniphaga]EIT68955.1 nitrilase/cyanide hydratase and apolipoprotein N-acyltransferase [Hydrocarboniphaga effusa AP103]MDZ4081163.1 carbon-nitrogen hydrolase family protein [Hydrocarboniphaga sp.]
MTLVAAIQLNTGADLDANLQASRTLVAEAAQAGAKLAALPENFAFMGRKDPDKLALAEPEGSGPIQQFLSDLAREYAIDLIAGTVPVAVPGDPGRVYPACLVYGASGARLARYDKIHLFDVDVDRGDHIERYRESATIAYGEPAYVVAPTQAGAVGLSVCYDIRFPELYRGLVQRGAELLCIPAAFTDRTGEAHWEILLRARAVENQCFVIAPGQCGTHASGRKTWGHTMIVDAWGQVLAERAEDTPGVVLADLDFERLRSVRESLPSLKHRRL